MVNFSQIFVERGPGNSQNHDTLTDYTFRMSGHPLDYQIPHPPTLRLAVRDHLPSEALGFGHCRGHSAIPNTLTLVKRQDAEQNHVEPHKLIAKVSPFQIFRGSFRQDTLPLRSLKRQCASDAYCESETHGKVCPEPQRHHKS